MNGVNSNGRDLGILILRGGPITVSDMKSAPSLPRKLGGKPRKVPFC